MAGGLRYMQNIEVHECVSSMKLRATCPSGNGGYQVAIVGIACFKAVVQELYNTH